MATIGWSNAAILGLFFGRDDLAVQYTFPSGVTRTYVSLSAVAAEMGRSRIYGGIHFEFDSDAGRSIGLNASNYIFLNVMKPR
jgi:membrane-associated phospholipid phosphatase